MRDDLVVAQRRPSYPEARRLRRPETLGENGTGLLESGGVGAEDVQGRTAHDAEAYAVP